MTGVIVPQNSTEAKNLSRKYQKGKLRRVCRAVYTDELSRPLEEVVVGNWLKIVAAIVPGAILSHRTAIELKPTPRAESGNRLVFLTGKYSFTRKLPGLEIKVGKGDTQKYTEQVLPNVLRSNRARAILENLLRTRSSLGISKSLNREELEKYLVEILRAEDEKGLNALRDEAKEIAKEFKLNKPFKKLQEIISQLLNSATENTMSLQTEIGRAYKKREQYDEQRINLFNALALYLQKANYVKRLYSYQKKTWSNISFFESYFSNYIEGTEFLIDEAEDIVYSGRTIENRQADSHDILSLYHLLNDYGEMLTRPTKAQEFIEILQAKHNYLLRQRPEKNPGKFKSKINRAGNTVFVRPEEVKGTLFRAYEILETLSQPLSRALYLMFVISEVHPFDDGNGRLARLMMNSELAASGEQRIILPTVFRDNYLGGLRRLSRDSVFHTYCKVLDQAHAYTQSLPWETYGEARARLEDDKANLTADEGLPIFYRSLRTLKLSSLSAE